ncbi:virulence RhuM family protein [bacterium]|nr:virulence RhuM family protein [bacterium]
MAILIPDGGMSRQFFKVIQNKMHWAAHGHTAAEIISVRADASQPQMGLTSWKGNKPTLADIQIAKNYLSPEELDVLNKIVSMYLDFAELQALQQKPISMSDWVVKLDDFLRISERDILMHLGHGEPR